MQHAMSAGVWRRVVTVAAAVPALLVSLTAQETLAPRVSLGFAAGPPGKQVTVPILLDGATGKKIGRMVSEVSFPAGSLTFIRLESAALLKSNAFEAVARLRDASDVPVGRETEKVRGKSQGVVEVRISSRKEGTNLPDGILGYLVFQIQPSLSPEKTPEILLTQHVSLFSGRLETASPLPSTAEGAKLVVEKPGLPVISCFFYMH